MRPRNDKVKPSVHDVVADMDVQLGCARVAEPQCGLLGGELASIKSTSPAEKYPPNAQ